MEIRQKECSLLADCSLPYNPYLNNLSSLESEFSISEKYYVPVDSPLIFPITKIDNMECVPSYNCDFDNIHTHNWDVW